MLKHSYNIGSKEVIAYIPKKANPQLLKQLYDTCNEIFAGHNCFYSKAEVKELKKDKTNIFIGG